MEIKRLNSDVITKIRSSFNVTSVAQCISELIANSLDAKSTSIAVRINLIMFKIQVADNGEGLTKENMELLGIRYMTSKCHNLVELDKHLNTYGFRGEALSSIVEMCKSVNIISRSKNCSETYYKNLSKDFRSEVKLAKHRASVGTTVTVLGFLSNFPVRQQRIIQEIELEEVKKYMKNLIIINPATSFSFRDDVTGLLILNSPKSCDIIGSFRHLHPDISDSFTLLKVSKSKIIVDALIHKEFIVSKKVQYLYVNKRPVLSHKILTNVNNSFYKKMELQAKRRKHPIYESKRYPIFVLNIKCPQSHVDVVMGPSKSEVEFKCWDLIFGCIDKIIMSFFGSNDKNEKKTIVKRKKDDRVSYGVSQVLGAVQACAYKRKSEEIMAGGKDNFKTDDNKGDHQNSLKDKPPTIKKSKLSRLEQKKEFHPINGNKNKPLQSFAKDKTAVLSSLKAELSGNYQIEDSDQKEPCLKPRKLKSIIKKPLPIRVGPKSCDLESKLNSACFELEKTKPYKCLALSRREEEFLDHQLIRPECQFDQKSAYSGLTTDQNQGKNLIMDMFLKSTQVFTGEDGESRAGGKSCPNISNETIEESNFVLENNIRDTVKGINTTMSISVNVKKKRMKNYNKQVSKCIQTSIMDERSKKLTSKSVQTSKKPNFERVRSNLSDLTHQFDGFNLKHFNDEKDNYTIVINTTQKRKEFRLVRKSEEMEVDICTEEQSFRPLKICHCQEEGDGKIFKFAQEDKLALLNSDDTSVLGPSTAMKENHFERPDLPKIINFSTRTNEHHFNNKGNYQTTFKKPQTPARTETRQNCDNKININNLHFQGIRKHSGLMKLQSLNVCERSPYFGNKANEKQFVPTSNFIDNNLEQKSDFRPYKDFQPRFKSTQFRQNRLQDIANAPRNNAVISSPYFIRKDECFEFQPNNRLQPGVSEGFPMHSSDPIRRNECFLPGYHNFDQNCVNICHTQQNYDYFRPQNTGVPHLCCPENLCPPQKYQAISHQYFGLPRDNEIKFQRQIECKPFSRYKEDLCPKNHRKRIIFPERRSLIRNTYIPMPDFQHNDDNVQHMSNDIVTHDMTQVELVDHYNISLENQIQRTEVMTEHVQNVSLEEEAPWYTPNVSNESNYFDRPVSDEEGVLNGQKEGVFRTQNVFLTQHIKKLDDKRQKIVEEKQNFKFGCTPDIFCETFCETQRLNKLNNGIFSKSAESCALNKSGEYFGSQEKMKKPGKNENCYAFLDLASFGIAEPKVGIETMKTVCPSPENSNLEITVVSNQEKRDIIQKQIDDTEKNNRNNLLSCESDLRVVDTKKMEKKGDEKSRIIVDSQNEWIRKYNEAGVGFYVNTRTGMVTTAIPKIDQAVFCFDRRLDFIPKGMSPVLKEHEKVDRSLSQNAKNKLHDFILESYENELMAIKWQHFICDDPKKFFEEIYKEKSKQFENGIPSIQDASMKMKIHKDIVNFNSKMFKTLKVVGQLDKKFIAVIERTKKLVILFDQHAVHERIRVEQFLKEYKGLKSHCREKLTFFMPRNDLSLLKNHSAYLNSIGLDVEFFTDGLKILHIPLCLQEKFKPQGNSEDLDKIINTLIKELVESLKESRGSTSRLPKIIHNVISLKACRGAIKFGDSLTKAECEKLLNDLAKCNLPYQCAHGRPTLTPVLTLNDIKLNERGRNKPNLKKLMCKKNIGWMPTGKTRPL